MKCPCQTPPLGLAQYISSLAFNEHVVNFTIRIRFSHQIMENFALRVDIVPIYSYPNKSGLDFTRYGNDWSLGSPLFVAAMPIPSPSTGSSALSHAIKRPQRRVPPRPVHFHFWCSDQSNMQAVDGELASKHSCSWKHWFARALMADPINSARSSSQCTTL
jgi:hypothetical protein